MPEESREERVKRIARTMLEVLAIHRVARFEPAGRERWNLIIYGEQVVTSPFKVRPSDDVMRRELRKSVRNALDHSSATQRPAVTT